MKRGLQSEEMCLSIVIPVYNEEEGLGILRDRLLKTVESWQSRGWRFGVELILVNDGSSDGSKEIMDRFPREDPRFNIVHLSRNFGHQEAITAGLSVASGDCIAILDADLQDPPEIVGNFLEKWESGLDIVYGIRKNRRENIFKRTCYNLFYRVYKRLANIDIPLDSGDFCLMDRRVVNVLNSFPEKIRFVRGLRSWAGFKQCGITYNRIERGYGVPKYTFAKLARLAFRGFFGFSTVPLRIATTIGFIFVLIGFSLAITIIIFYFGNISVLGRTPAEVAGLTSLFSGGMFFFGFQLLVLGVIGEYIGLLYFEVKGRPTYIIDSINGNLKHPKAPFGIGPASASN